ncbi:MAG: NUDIX hydrolase [Acidimicrobiales bacterium]
MVSYGAMVVHRRRRDSARVIVLDEHGNVLLVRIVDPVDGGPPLWQTPGGGVEADEALVEAARRELREETGLRVTAEDLGDPVAVTKGNWAFRGELLTSEDTFFLLRTVRYEPNVDGQETLEAEIHDCWRWWSVDDLAAAEEAILPGGLADLLSTIGEHGPPSEPCVLPWLTI